MANQYTSRGGIVVHAHVASPAEAGMQVRLPNGIDQLQPGDALVSLSTTAPGSVHGNSFVVRAELFAALFGGDAIDETDPTARGLAPSGDAGKGKGKGKGGQHEVSVAHIPPPPDGTRSGA
jgi:hypothetical protein